MIRIRCNLSSSHDGSPKSTELQLSSREVTNAWTSFSVDAWSRYRRKRPILYRAYDAVLHYCWRVAPLSCCCQWLHQDSWRMVPSQHQSHRYKMKALVSKGCDEGADVYIISVLLSFSISMLVDIQHLMSMIQRLIAMMAEAIKHCSWGLNVIYNCVSSAYIMQWRLCTLTMSSWGSWTW